MMTPARGDSGISAMKGQWMMCRILANELLPAHRRTNEDVVHLRPPI
jgi:hypothetical protein